MPFMWKLNDGTEFEFPTARETGKLKHALRVTRDLDKQNLDTTFAIIEEMFGSEGELIEAYEKVDFEDEKAWSKKFFGGLDPKA